MGNVLYRYVENMLRDFGVPVVNIDEHSIDAPPVVIDADVDEEGLTRRRRPTSVLDRM